MTARTGRRCCARRGRGHGIRAAAHGRLAANAGCSAGRCSSWEHAVQAGGSRDARGGAVFVDDCIVSCARGSIPSRRRWLWWLTTCTAGRRQCPGTLWRLRH
jgi:hypothetical protein